MFSQEISKFGSKNLLKIGTEEMLATQHGQPNVGLGQTWFHLQRPTDHRGNEPKTCPKLDFSLFSAQKFHPKTANASQFSGLHPVMRKYNQKVHVALKKFANLLCVCVSQLVGNYFTPGSPAAFGRCTGHACHWPPPSGADTRQSSSGSNKLVVGNHTLK